MTGAAAVPLVAGLALAAAGTTLWLRRRYAVVDVIGVSMSPAYHPGDRVLVRRVPGTAVRRGAAVVFEPDYGTEDAAGPRPRVRSDAAIKGRSWLLKRAVAVPGDPVPRHEVPALRDVPEAAVPPGCLVVLGDNPPASLDSREFGYVAAERVLGVVVRLIR